MAPQALLAFRYYFCYSSRAARKAKPCLERAALALVYLISVLPTIEWIPDIHEASH